MSAEDEIRALLETYERALNTGDAQLAVSCFTGDGVVMPQGVATASGADLPAMYQHFFAIRSYDIRFVVDELLLLGEDVAQLITSSAGTLRMLADDRRYEGANREMFLVRRVDGRWRFARYLFNNDGPQGSPAS